MRFECITIFPEFMQEASNVGILGRAKREEKISMRALSPREFATDKHRTIDDAPFGGGSGMVMKAPPLFAALRQLESERAGQNFESARHRTYVMSPRGKRFDQRAAESLAALDSLTLVCGRYEGIDERVIESVDGELSLGDFVLMGGEIAALAVIEATARLLPSVLGNADSATSESHSMVGLEYPQYTRPAEFEGRHVPDVLLSGDHAKIAAWRQRQSRLLTQARRPDLLNVADDEAQS